MTPRDARRLAERLMADHGLASPWSFGFDRAKHRCGQCSYRRSRITLSRYYLARNTDADIENTIRHEIAHALVGPGHGHKAVWRAMAVRCGARPVRCNAQADMSAAPERITRVVYRLTCHACSKVWEQARMTRRARLEILTGHRWHARCGKGAKLTVERITR